MTSVILSKSFVKEFRRLSKGVSLLWTLGALVILLFVINFMGEGTRPGVFASYQFPKQILNTTALTGGKLAQVNGDISQTNPVQVNSASVQQKGQVKALTNLVIPFSGGSVTRSLCGISLYTGGYTCIQDNQGSLGVGSTLSYLNITQFVNPVLVTKWSTVVFSLAALPAGDSVISASLGMGYSSCGNNGFSVSGYATSVCAASVSLGGTGAAAIQASKASIGSFIMNFSGGSGVADFSSLVLYVTSGQREVHLTVNGSTGLTTAKAGSNVNLGWSEVGYSQCNYASIPAWYTPGWPIGSAMPLPSGSTTTKIYYENVTYRVECKDSGSGAVGADQVTVNVTP